MLVQELGVLDTHALLRNERITAVSAPLLVERRNSSLPTVGNDIANPLRTNALMGRALGPLSPPDISQSGKGHVSASATAQAPARRKWI
jgi:hypothetical protein